MPSYGFHPSTSSTNQKLPSPHRALQILDILDLLLAPLPSSDLAVCARICRAWFEPAVRHLWRRKAPTRAIFDALGLGSDDADSYTPRQLARRAHYLSHLTTMEFALTDEPDYMREPYVLTSHDLMSLSTLHLPALETLTFTVSHPSALDPVLMLAGEKTCTVHVLFLATAPPQDAIEMLGIRVPNLTELAMLTHTEAQDWPQLHALDALPRLRRLRKLHLQGEPLMVQHILTLGKMDELEQLTLAHPLPDSSPGSAVLIQHIPSPQPGETRFPAIKKIEIASGPFTAALHLLSALPPKTRVERFALKHTWTTPTLFARFLRLLWDRTPFVKECVLSLRGGLSPHELPPTQPETEEYNFLPFSRLTNLTVLDLTLTSYEPVWIPALTPELIAALSALHDLRELRLVTFDYSYHYASRQHAPLISLGDLAPLATGCPNLEVLQVEFALPYPPGSTLQAFSASSSSSTHLPLSHSIPPLPPPPPPHRLKRLLISWSRLPPPSPALTEAARWTARVFTHAKLGWGRWAHEEADVPDGVWSYHRAFGRLDAGEQVPEAAAHVDEDVPVEEQVIPGAFPATDVDVAAMGETDVQSIENQGQTLAQTDPAVEQPGPAAPQAEPPIHLQHADMFPAMHGRRGPGEEAFAGVDTARLRARAFAMEIEKWQAVYRQEKTNLEVPVTSTSA